MMYDESPANFASRQMERAGVHYHFSQDASAETMIIGDTNTSFSSTGLSLIYRGHFRDTTSAGDFIASFHLKSSLYTQTAAVAGYNFEQPNFDIYAAESHAGGIGEKYEYAADITEGVAAANRASVNADREFRNSRQCSGISNAADLKAGHIFSLADRSGTGFSGRYLITQVRHLALWNQERSCFVYCNVFSAIPNNVTFRPKRMTPLPKVPGVVTAVVTGPAEETQYVDDYGRIKVQFRWDRQGSNNENSSAWIRVLIPAGRLDELFIPLIGSEVVVSFIQGDPSLPMVLGSVYNPDYPPPFPY
jgi:type VI secretion system secreted protein VgrG